MKLGASLGIQPSNGMFCFHDSGVPQREDLEAKHQTI